jgi:chromosome partitioning protein
MDVVNELRALHRSGQKAEFALRTTARARFEEHEGPIENGSLKPRPFTLPEAARFLKVSGSRVRQLVREFDESEGGIGERRGSNRFLSKQDIDRIRAHLFKTTKNETYHPQRFLDRGDKLQVLACVNFKGGVGKSTTTLTLAEYLAVRGYRVLIIDLDAQATSTTILRGLEDLWTVAENHSVAGFTREAASAAELIKPTYFPGISLIPGSFELQDAEWETIKRMRDNPKYRFWRELRPLIDEIRDGSLNEQFDVVLLDCKPDSGIFPMAALYASTALLIPAVAETPDLASTNEFLRVLADNIDVIRTVEGSESLNLDFVRILCTRFDRQSNTQADSFQNMQVMYRAALYPEPMAKTELISIAYADQRLPLTDTPKSINSKTYSRGIAVIETAMEQIERDLLKVWGRALKRGDDE